jgi:hypothetical protein
MAETRAWNGDRRAGGLARAARAATLAAGCAVFLLALLGPLRPPHAELGDGAVTDRLDEKAEVFRQWMPLALRGDPLAQFRLGRAFVTGRTEPEDFAEAARWLRKAAEQGLPRAQSDLALLYEKGLGVQQSYVEAYAWLDVAAERFGYGRRRDQALEMRDMLAAFMTPTERSRARALATDRRRALGLGLTPRRAAPGAGKLSPE